MSDVTLVCDGQEFPAHRVRRESGRPVTVTRGPLLLVLTPRPEHLPSVQVILSAQSTVLRSMLAGGFREVR